MIKRRGKITQNVNLLKVDLIIESINKLYPIAEPINLWFIEDREVRTGKAGMEYGYIVTNKPGEPTMFIATLERDPEQIAGTIAMQYAIYMQQKVGFTQDIEQAINFAKYLAGKGKARPKELIHAYNELEAYRKANTEREGINAQ